VIVATNRDLAGAVKKGSFREDLYYRLLGLPIELPPLRERGNDILILAKFFLDEFCIENDLPRKTISSPARKKLLKHPYPGNVRELKAVVELAAVMAKTDVIEEEDISFPRTGLEKGFLNHEDTLAGYTKKIISHYLHKHNKNVALVASKLNVGKSTIYRMIKEDKL
jgi:two-component system, NtrC family, response regulator AtoC